MNKAVWLTTFLILSFTGVAIIAYFNLPQLFTANTEKITNQQQNSETVKANDNQKKDQEKGKNERTSDCQSACNRSCGANASCVTECYAGCRAGGGAN